MLYPPISELLQNVESRYLLVNLVARRARTLASNAEETNTPMDDKPVSCAIDEVYEGKLTIREE